MQTHLLVRFIQQVYQYKRNEWGRSQKTILGKHFI